MSEFREVNNMHMGCVVEGTEVIVQETDKCVDQSEADGETNGVGEGT